MASLFVVRWDGCESYPVATFRCREDAQAFIAAEEQAQGIEDEARGMEPGPLPFEVIEETLFDNYGFPITPSDFPLINGRLIGC